MKTSRNLLLGSLLFAGTALNLKTGASGQAAAAPEPPASIPGSPASPGATSRTVRETTVSAVYVSGKEESLKGGTAPVAVSVGDNPSGAPAVGVLEEIYGGIGSQCRASAWIAAMASSQAMDGMINDHKFTVQVGHHADGPSMGMLLAATMLALMKGDPILPGVTMTGAVNPDGTAGPVGSIPVKIEAVKESGFKTFGYPVGCRMDLNPRTEKTVDVEEYGKSLGLKVVEVRNLYDAYQLLTGKEWPRVTPLPESRLRISGPLSKRIEEACTTLAAEIDNRQAEIVKASQPIRADESASRKNAKQNPVQAAMTADLSRDIEAASAFRRRAAEAMAGGAIAQAYLNLRVSDQLFGIAEAEENLLLPLLKKSKREAADDWHAFYLKTREEAGRKLAELQAVLKTKKDDETLGERVDVLHSYLQYGESLVDYLWADSQRAEIDALFKRVKEAGDDDEAAAPLSKLLGLLKGATIGWSRAGRRAQSTLQWSKFTAQPGPPVTVPPELYEKLGRAYASASGATLGYLDALIVRSQAEYKGITPEAAAAEFEKQERDYGFIKAATDYAQLESRPSGGLSAPSEPLERFTTALYAYTGASALLMKYYTFHGMTPAGSGAQAGLETSTQFTRRKALSATLDGARERVLEECAKLEAEAGIVPDAIKLNFDLASTLRDGNSDAERMLALKAYWRCNLLCHLTRLLARQ